MDNTSQTNTTTPPTKKSLYIIVFLLLFITGLAVALIWCILFYKHPAAPTATTPAPVAEASAPCSDGSENPAPAGYTLYENAALGYKFAYPSEWGAVAVTTTPLASETGDYLRGSFAAKDNVSFGGNTVSYTVGAREGIATDLPGYLEADSKFYTVELWKFSDGTTTEERHDLHKIDPPYEQIDGCNAKGLVTHQAASAELGTPAYDVYRFNLQPTNAYYGVNFAVANPDAATTSQVQALAGTFQLIP